MKNLTKHISKHILETNYIGHLAFISENKPYVVPITYFYDSDENCILSYSAEGHKINAMRINSAVSLEVSEIKSVDNWQSILVHGEFEELVGTHAKQQLHKFALGVKKILLIKENKQHQLISDFSSKITSNRLPIVYRIKLLDITGKCREY
jgi:nitroimidazol reductase NimA-like FMN-containing flavoprotein (pyridoxamine 5'-phosphate oxidase superfamily)